MTDIPPYFNIRPDKALAELPPPMDTAALRATMRAVSEPRSSNHGFKA